MAVTVPCIWGGGGGCTPGILTSQEHIHMSKNNENPVGPNEMPVRSKYNI